MTRICPFRPILQIFLSIVNLFQAKTLTSTRGKQVVKINYIQRSLEYLHKEVSVSSQARLDRSIEAHSQATNIHTLSFSVGDFVFVRRATDRGHKLQFRFCGPP